MKPFAIMPVAVALIIAILFSIPAVPAASAGPADDSPSPGGPLVEPLDRNSPGHAGGVGRTFTVRGSRYLDVTLSASAVVEASIDSVPSLITIRLAAVESPSVEMSIGGLIPNTAFHLYRDDYHNHTPFTTDASGGYRFALDLSIPALLFIQPVSSTVFLTATGFSKPVGTWNAVTRTATLTTNVGETIQIDISNVTLDGAGFTVTGSGTGNGVYATNKTAVNVKNLNVRGFSNGLYFAYGTGGTISNCTFSSNTSGVILERSPGFNLQNNQASQNSQNGFRLNYSGSSILTGNTATGNGAGAGPVDEWFGIYLYYSGGNTLTNNIMNGNGKNFAAFSYNQADMTQNINTTNLADGKPVVYICNASGQTIDASSNAAVVYLVGCSNMVVKDVSVTRSIAGVYFNYVTNSRVENITTTLSEVGIYCQSSKFNTFAGNTVTNNYFGILPTPLAYTSDNQILDNNISGSTMGIQFNSPNTVVAGNTIQGSTKGIFLQYGSNSVVRGNDISGCTDYALWVRSGQNSRIFGNTFRNCGPKSLWMDSAGPGDTVFNNNFLDAPPRILIAGTYVNAYNLAAPTGGNFFAVWPGPDLNNDGFVDSPYVIQAGYQDNLPWTRQDGWLPVTTAALSGTVGNGGWFRSDVTLTLTATDNEGIAATRYSYDGRNWQTYTAPLTLASPGTTTVYYRSTDLVGHVERTRNVQVKIDKTAPAVTFGTPSPAPNAAGWNNTAVSVPFTATDDLSGVAFTVPAASPLVISAEGAPLTASVTAADNAGNTATASVSGIKIDRTPPVVTITSPTEGAFFLINDAATAAWDAVDALSGIASRSSSALDTSQAGVKTFTATATDYAGNSGSASRAYTVMSAGDAIGWLIARVQSLGLDRGIENSLVAKLQNARASLEKGNKTAAVNQLQAFLNELNAQSGKKVPAPDAGAIGTFTVRLIGCLG